MSCVVVGAVAMSSSPFVNLADSLVMLPKDISAVFLRACCSGFEYRADAASEEHTFLFGCYLTRQTTTALFS
jgi:hypothetical protein